MVQEWSDVVNLHGNFGCFEQDLESTFGTFINQSRRVIVLLFADVVRPILR